jgi:uncharacterized membrane protein
MLLTGISLLGWVHSFACVMALFTGAHVLIARKGTARHRVWGRWYAAAMVAQSLLVMGVYNFDYIPGPHAKPGPHIFGFFHWGSLLALAAVALALFSAARQQRHLAWAHVHAQSMLFSYYLLISALINELFARVAVFRAAALALSPQATTTLGTMLVRQAQLAGLIAWVGCALWFALKVCGRRRPPAFTIGYPLRYGGGVFVACVGAGIFAGAILGRGMMTWGLLAGFLAGIIFARRVAPRVAGRWGSSSLAQGRAMTIAVTLEFAVFNVLGASGAFAFMGRAATWEVSLAIVGAHFLLMRWSHGRLMMALGIAVLAWLGLGVAAHLPLAAVAMGDGLLKLGFGVVMAWPLLKQMATDRSAPGYPPASRPPHAGFPG